MVQELPVMALYYERDDTHQAFYSVFTDWNAALQHARWVAESPEHNLLKVETSIPKLKNND